MKIKKIDINDTIYKEYTACIHRNVVRTNMEYGRIGILCDADTDG
jgi:hypothetical protein